MVKLEGLKQNYKTYGGMSCIKIGLTIDDIDYLVKYPSTLKARKINDVILSYSNSPVCDNVLTEILKTDFSKVYELIDNCNVLSEVQHEFYDKILHERERKLREIGEGIIQSSARSATQDIGGVLTLLN